MRLALVALLLGIATVGLADTGAAPGVTVACAIGALITFDSGASPPGNGGSTGPTPPCTVTPQP